MRNNKKSVRIKMGAAGVALLGVGLSSLALAGPPVNMIVKMDNGCPQEVNDAGDSCPSKTKNEACAVMGNGATVLHWTSDNGEAIEIIFKSTPPAGVNQNNGGNSGNVSATITPNANEGRYEYAVKGARCTLDPVIIVKP